MFASFTNPTLSKSYRNEVFSFFNFSENIKKFIGSFFQKIQDSIEDYRIVKEEERKRKKLEEIQRKENERIERKKQEEAEEELKIKLKEKAIKEDTKIEKEIAKDIKLFLRKEQAILRKEQSERQRKFLEELKIQKQTLFLLSLVFHFQFSTPLPLKLF